MGLILVATYLPSRFTRYSTPGMPLMVMVSTATATVLVLVTPALVGEAEPQLLLHRAVQLSAHGIGHGKPSGGSHLGQIASIDSCAEHPIISHGLPVAAAVCKLQLHLAQDGTSLVHLRALVHIQPIHLYGICTDLDLIVCQLVTAAARQQARQGHCCRSSRSPLQKRAPSHFCCHKKNLLFSNCCFTFASLRRGLPYRRRLPSGA